MAALCREESRLRNEQRELRQLEKCASRKEQRRRLRCDVSAAVPRPGLRRVLLLFYWAAVGYSQAAVHMLRVSQRRWLFEDVEDEALGSYMEAVFLEVPLDVIQALLDSGDPEVEDLRNEAFRLHAEYLTAQWIRERNRTHGLAPTSALVRRLYDEFLSQHPVDIAFQRFEKRTGANQAWSSRFRARWGGRFGTLQCTDVDTVEVLREKAWTVGASGATFWGRPGGEQWCGVLGLFWSPFSGPFCFVLTSVLSWRGNLRAAFRGRLSGPSFGHVLWFSGAPVWTLSQQAT